MLLSPITRYNKPGSRSLISHCACRIQYGISSICCETGSHFAYFCLPLPTFHNFFENAHTDSIRIFNRLPTLPQAALGDPNGASRTPLLQARNERGLPSHLHSTPTSSTRYKFHFLYYLSKPLKSSHFCLTDLSFFSKNEGCDRQIAGRIQSYFHPRVFVQGG